MENIFIILCYTWLASLKDSKFTSVFIHFHLRFWGLVCISVSGHSLFLYFQIITEKAVVSKGWYCTALERSVMNYWGAYTSFTRATSTSVTDVVQTFSRLFGSHDHPLTPRFQSGSSRDRCERTIITCTRCYVVSIHGGSLSLLGQASLFYCGTPFHTLNLVKLISERFTLNLLCITCTCSIKTWLIIL